MAKRSMRWLAALLPALAWGCAGPERAESDGPNSRAFRIEPRAAQSTALATRSGDAGGAAGASADPAAEEAAALGALAERLELPVLLRLAAARNPRIAAARARWKAAIEKNPQALSLPDPMVELAAGWTEGERGVQEWEYTFRQEVPFPTKILLEGEVADREAEIARLQYEASVRDELVEAQEVFHELVYLGHAEKTIALVEELMQRYTAFAGGELGKGGTTLPETFRAQAQLAQLQYDRVLVRELAETERARLRALAGLRAGTPLGEAQAPPIRPVSARLPDLYSLAERHNQELKAAGISIDKALAEVDLARQGRIPDLELELEWTAPDTGKEPDELMAMVGFNLPVWENRNAAKVREAHAMREAAVAERGAELARVEATVARLHFRLQNTARLAALYRDSLLPQATQAMNAAEELFRAGKASFAATIETAAAWYNFQLAHHRARADHAQALARLEQILGTTIEPVRRDGAGATESAEHDEEGR